MMECSHRCCLYLTVLCINMTTVTSGPLINLYSAWAQSFTNDPVIATNAGSSNTSSAMYAGGSYGPLQKKEIRASTSVSASPVASVLSGKNPAFASVTHREPLSNLTDVQRVFLKHSEVQFDRRTRSVTDESKRTGSTGVTLTDTPDDTVSVGTRVVDGKEVSLEQSIRQGFPVTQTDAHDDVYLIDSATCAGANNQTMVFESPGMIVITGRTYTHFVTCDWQLRAPAGRFIVVTTESYTIPCHYALLIIYDFDNSSENCFTSFCAPVANPVPVVYSISTMLHFSMSFKIFPTEEIIKLRFSFASQQPAHKRILGNFTSALRGFIMSPSYGQAAGFPPCCDDTYRLQVPDDHAVMISFSDFHIMPFGSDLHKSYLSLFQFDATSTSYQLVWKRPRGDVDSRNSGLPPTAIYNSSLLFRFFSDAETSYFPGFKLAFSFHNQSSVPMQRSDGMFDCSTSAFHTFRQHLGCDFAVDCIHGEDELDCPGTAAECNGSLKYGNKCYDYFMWKEHLSWDSAENICRQRGQQLMTFKTKDDWHAVQMILHTRKSLRDIFVGLRTVASTLPVYYKYAWRWSDSTINYLLLPFETSSSYATKTETCYKLRSGIYDLREIHCSEKAPNDILCETTLPVNLSVIVSTPPKTDSWLKPANSLLNMYVCPRGHVTHDFLSCVPSSDCKTRSGEEAHCEKGTSVFGVYSCADGHHVPFTLMCDHHYDCADMSDESFCVHPLCQTDCEVNQQCSVKSRCETGQCIPLDSLCDGRQDCMDGSDETCVILRRAQVNVTGLTSQTLVNFDGYGSFMSVPLSKSVLCPETHFLCPDSYCLPVYLRCNQVYDCPGWEDEADCSTYACPGYYRCRHSAVCLHADHVCDGVFQCPQQDDELLCGLSCPEGCQCQGLAFVCATPFPVDEHRHVRYVDASGSGLTPDHFVHSHYLIYLRLSHNKLQNIGNVLLPNLRILDISDNTVSSFTTAVLERFRNLQTLRLANNPLVALTGSRSSTPHVNLHIIDLSHTLMVLFAKDTFSMFVNLKVVNISFSGLITFPEHGLQQNSNLEVLDFRGVYLETFSGDILKHLTKLQTVYTENYRLCCRSLLPNQFDPKKCFAPTDEISSCEDLLRSDTYRLFLWLFVAFSTAGNAGSLLFRLYFQKFRTKAGHNVFVTNLSAADLLMGIYLTIIGVADHVYRGKYLWHDLAWKGSIFCKIAGFVSFLSNEVSAFIIFLITIDRLIALRFPFSVLKFQRKAAVAACGLVWVVGLVLAAVPLLPMTSDWKYYSQTGICIPLPITRSHFKGRGYSFGVMIIFNLVIFLLIAGGQAFIYWSVRLNSMQGDFTSKKSQDATIARRLITVALSDFVCWFPVGLLGVLASLGIPISGEVNVVMVIFVLPVNSALNPFLYTFNMIMEKRRRAKKMQRMKWIEEELINKLGAFRSNTGLTL